MFVVFLFGASHTLEIQCSDAIDEQSTEYSNNDIDNFAHSIHRKNQRAHIAQVIYWRPPNDWGFSINPLKIETTRNWFI